jgi:two-component system response regulator NreC
MTRLRIALSDDHAVVRAGLRMVLETQSGWMVVAESGDAGGAARDVAVHRPDVLVLDLTMPGRPSLEVLRDLRRDAPATAVVILTMEADPIVAREALAGGASAYVLKESADEQLVQAIRTVADGGTYLDPALGAAVATGRPARPVGRGVLTARELDVLRLIALGHTNREIAGRLGVSVRTIESHRGRISAKTGRTRRAELVALALTAGLLDARGSSTDSAAGSPTWEGPARTSGRGGASLTAARRR